jgi:hypothetical protein
MEQSVNFVGAKYWHDSACGSGRLEIACPDSRSGLDLRLSSSKIERKDYHLLITSRLQFRVPSVNCTENLNRSILG